MSQQFDVAVIGSGPGGYVAAIRASQLGLKTACIEKADLGGVCLNWGCIPSKALLTNAALMRKLKKPADWGLEIPEITVKWDKVIKRSRNVASRLNKGVAGLFKKYDVTHIAGAATFERPGQLTVGDETIEATHIIVATGARARQLPGLPFDGDRVMSYREAMVVDEKPERLLIVGAGAIGCEFAYFFNAFGTKVTLAEMAPHIVPVEDEDVSDALAKSFKRQGIDVRTNTLASGFEVTDSGVTATLKTGEKDGETLAFDRVLVAIGVVCNTDNINLAEMGVELEHGRIIVDEDLNTTCPGIYALGDITAGPALAHKASFQGVHCAERIAGHQGKPVDPDNIPSCTYCEPQVASVGLTEAQAKATGRPLKVGKFPFNASGKALATGQSEGFTKVIHDADTGEMLGCHMIGHGVTDLIAEATLARHMESTEEDILSAVHPHPTLSEALHEAIGQAFGEGVNF